MSSPLDRFVDDLHAQRREEPDLALVARAQRGDAAARARLVEECLPRVAGVASLYRSSPSIQRVELVQEGVVGLLRALERFDPERGVPFWAYASWWVRQAMQQLVAELTRPLVLSDRALRHLARVRTADEAIRAEHGRTPRREELADRSGLTVDQVAQLLAAERTPSSLDEPVHADDGPIGTFGELLADPMAEGEYERVLDALETEQVVSLLSELSERERDILSARYEHERSLRDIGAGLGMSGERVRQIEQRALAKLEAAGQRD